MLYLWEASSSGIWPSARRMALITLGQTHALATRCAGRHKAVYSPVSVQTKALLVGLYGDKR